MQYNIQHWFNNRYIFNVELSSHSPEVILLNEISTPPDTKPKLLGYQCLHKSSGPNSGVAIFIKNHIEYENIPLDDDNTLAIKLSTNIGKIIITTSYIPPRSPILPIISLTKLCKFKLPLLIMSDFNANHRYFYGNSINPMGTSLYNFCINQNINHLGPQFHTFCNGRIKSRPDIILANQQFNLFHHLIIQGKAIRPDHIPVIIKIQTQPFKVLKPPKVVISKLNIDTYRSHLKDIQFNSLDGQHYTEIDTMITKVNTNIIEATELSCPKSKISIINSYNPTPFIIQKFKQYQSVIASYMKYGYPNINKVNEMRLALSNLIRINQQENWDLITKIAYDSYGEPKKFWKRFNQLKGNKTATPPYIIPPTDLIYKANLNIVPGTKITNKEEQAVIFSKCWATIFRSNEGDNFKNSNTRKVHKWYSSIKPSLTKSTYINYQNLIPEHPLLRIISISEIVNTIKTIKDRSPGPSGIRSPQIKYLPPNFITAFYHIYNSILSTSHYPEFYGNCNMIFAPKPGKDITNPMNYRPICLLEIMAKFFEKIIANRLSYYLEYHNIYNEKQFGFRSSRGTQHPITLLTSAISETKKQRRPAVVVTRDVQKAFDSVWHKGLLYKTNKLPDCILRFLALVYFYIKTRTINPIVFGSKGELIIPKAGVPQGSCLGPILFNIFVNDCPNPYYNDSLVFQFADDIVQLIRGPTLSGAYPARKRKFKSLKEKTEKELSRIKSWEDKWKIKTNTSKCAICVVAGNPNLLREAGGILLNGTSIQIVNSTTVLGYSFSNRINANIHCSKIHNKSSIALKRLYRFKNAPPKIKKHLYKALIRPLMDYPPYQVLSSGPAKISTLQKVQNRACRFINNVTLMDKCKTSALHEYTKLDPINIRLLKLSHKSLLKMKMKYITPEEDSPIYKLDDYSINTISQFPKKENIYQRMNNNIFYTNRKCIIESVPEDVMTYIDSAVPKYN